MAAIDDLVAQVKDPALRARLGMEVKKLKARKHFGLVFEEHLPECTLLYDVPVQKEALVARNGNADDLWHVLDMQGGEALCQKYHGQEQATIPVRELTTAAEFGESIYPYLEPLDTVENAPDSDLWHTVIEADNYHALQLLTYAYAGKVDCIYIDPPYNTGAKDWKYNNNYVDGNDQYRHSKWLSFMKHRLELAKRLLNPRDSVLIVTIDEKEYLHLGMLLEDMFPEARIQMVNIIINKNGVARTNEFKRAEEYAFFVMFGECAPSEMKTGVYSTFIDENDLHDEQEDVRWERLLRGGSNSLRSDRPNLFYPIYIDEHEMKIAYIGKAIPRDVDWHTVENPTKYRAFWPIRPDGTEATWRMQPSSLKKKIEKNLVKIGSYDKRNDRYTILYLADIQEERIKKGDIVITGYNDDGSVTVEYAKAKKSIPTTVWGGSMFSASEFGSKTITKVFGDKRFSFPKSFYATELTIAPFVKNKPNALILDFFAGSGTTLHAVNLLNASDGGHRRCIITTNNEISNDEAKAFAKQGIKRGDAEWEAHGIARYVTWPRTVCTIEGHDINGEPLKGKYLDSERPMADGFPANANFFHLGFLNKTAVSRGTQLEKLLPVLWLKAGAVGKCPVQLTDEHFLVLPENKFAILIDVRYTHEFVAAVEGQGYRVAYIVTDYEPEYRSIRHQLDVPQVYQLYKDYLSNFAINMRRA